MPTYRLSQMQFFMFTLAWYVFVWLVGFIIAATGGSGVWFAVLLGLGLFLPYLHYIACPRLRDMGHSPWWALTLFIPLMNLCAMVALLVFPGNRSANQGKWERIPAVAGLLAMLIIFLGTLLTTFAFLIAALTCFMETHWGCEDRGSKTAMFAETELMQSAMFAMMAEKKITTVTLNDLTNSSLGVNTWTAMPEGLVATPLAGYLKEAKTKFYYCWDSNGNVYPRSEDPDDAEKPGQCPQEP